MSEKLKALPTKAVAYHEAGHAVMAIHQRMRLLEVSIIPNAEQESLAHVRHRSVFGKLTPDVSLTNRTFANVERRVMVAQAGDVAVGIWNRRLYGRLHQAGLAGTEADVNVAYSMLNNASGSHEEVSAWYRLLRIRTIQILCNPMLWCAVDALAAEVMAMKHLSGARATRLIRTTMAKAAEGALDFDRLQPARSYLLKRC